MSSERTTKVSPGRSGSLRFRMLLGASIIALLALLAAGAMIYGSTTVAERINEATAAERRTELYGTLSARISDYAVVAIESASATDLSARQRLDRLRSRRELVDTAFDQAEAALAAHVARATDETEINRRASTSIGLARMRARFATLSHELETKDEPVTSADLRVQLDSFATQFSPLLDFAIGQERRQRAAAFRSIDDLRRTITSVAVGIAIAALLATVVFQIGLISPLLRRIGTTAQAAHMIGGGRLNTRLDIDRRDELGLLFANVNRMAARLDRRKRAVDADRARLNEIIDERTEALRSANAELERIDGNRRRFFSDVSHELRTPLTVILGETEIAMRAKSLSEEDACAAFQVINARARRLNRRVEDLLRIARSEGGQIHLENRPFEVSAAIDEAVEDVAGLARRRSITIGTETPEPLHSLGDVDWTRQVISGVLENALRHSEAGAAIRITCGVREGQIEIRVIDEGTGVAEGDLTRIFERFARGERGADSLGFGVGLALARWVMERQSGAIALTSPATIALSDPRRGPGTEVTLTLPHLIEDDE